MIVRETKAQTLAKDYGLSAEGAERKLTASHAYKVLGVLIVVLSALLTLTMIYGVYQLWQLLPK